jgi:hypothetical protein
MPRALRLTSISWLSRQRLLRPWLKDTHLFKTLRISITIPSRTCSCFERRLSNRSSTISLTLLSASLTISSAKAAAAAVTSAHPLYSFQRTLDGGRVLGECSQAQSSFILDGMRGRVQKLRDDSNPPRLIVS